MLIAIEDWDDAYANGAHIAGADAFPPRWADAAAQFRDRVSAAGRARLAVSYGEGDRHVFDLFQPEGESRGLAVFIHGGYWRAFDGQSWSHLAAGALDAGYHVAVPSYDLCPTVGIGDILNQMARAVARAAALTQGPIFLSGHSAGGHLVTRLVCSETPLPRHVAERVRAGRVLSISGVHDLRPLLRTQMNLDLRLDHETAKALSPALRMPADGTEVLCWVGARERPEFLRQSELLASIWRGCGAATASHIEPGRHHFDVIDDLAEVDSAMVRTWLGLS